MEANSSKPSSLSPLVHSPVLSSTSPFAKNLTVRTTHKFWAQFRRFFGLNLCSDSYKSCLFSLPVGTVLFYFGLVVDLVHFMIHILMADLLLFNSVGTNVHFRSSIFSDTYKFVGLLGPHFQIFLSSLMILL